jgi:hypothetical protein
MDVIIFMPFYLESRICPDAVLRWIQQQACSKFTANVIETLTMIRQTFREESMSCTWVFEWKSPNSPRLRKARHVESKVNSMLIIFINIKGTVHK